MTCFLGAEQVAEIRESIAVAFIMDTAQEVGDSFKNDNRPYLYVLFYDGTGNVGSVNDRLSEKVDMRDCVGPA